MPRIHHRAWIMSLLILLGSAAPAAAAPMFARQYAMPCQSCHTAFPKLNAFGEQFIGNNMRLPNWRDTTMEMGDERLALPKQLPLAVRAQAFAQVREAGQVDPATGRSDGSEFDFQAPYLIKLLSSAPLSEQITFYFYAILAEKGGNGEALVEDAWFRYGDLFGSGVSMQLGQFQVSDVMFPRELRLTFQDFIPYRMAGITYERGVLFERGFGPVDVALGAVNGNGITQNFDIDSPGFARPDNMFDNDSDKSAFGRVGVTLGRIGAGLFALGGEQRSSGDTRDTDKRVFGVDLSGPAGDKAHWYLQLLYNSWEGFLDTAPGRDIDWYGGFAGVDYIASDRWVFSGLWNYADAKDFDGTGTVYEGIDLNSLTAAASYYFMRNVKGVLELNYDLKSREPPGHLTREHYGLVGFDAAF